MGRLGNSFYSSHIKDASFTSAEPKQGRDGKDAFKYEVRSAKRGIIGILSVKPFGKKSIGPKPNQNEDYAVADRKTYWETYTVFFKPLTQLVTASGRDMRHRSPFLRDAFAVTV